MRMPPISRLSECFTPSTSRHYGRMPFFGLKVLMLIRRQRLLIRHIAAAAADCHFITFRRNGYAAITNTGMPRS